MTLHHQLQELLHGYQQQHHSLRGWRFNLHRTDGLDIGLKNNKIGGPYSAPGYKASISGDIYLIWEGQRFTSAKLDARVVEDFPDCMALWEKTAYGDPDGVDLYHPDTLPEVRLADDRIKEVVNGQFDGAFQLLSEGLECLRAAGIRKVDARIKCAQDRRVLMNSRGLQVEYEQTPMNFYFVANDSYGKGYAEKKWPDSASSRRVLDGTVSVGQMLEQPLNAKFSGPMTLIFPPEIFESFVEHFVIANLYGSLVVNRQSRFSVEDFQTGRQIFREDFGLMVNNLLPFRAGSYICTSEGVPGGEAALIDSGRLRTPVLNLKYARKTGMAPTPMPSGGFFFTSRQDLPDEAQLLKTMDRALIVHSVLGMHTQDSSSGQFSLTADQCLLVEAGIIKGKVKAVINGDFLAALNREDSGLYRVAGEDNPGLVFTASALSA